MRKKVEENPNEAARKYPVLLGGDFNIDSRPTIQEEQRGGIVCFLYNILWFVNREHPILGRASLHFLTFFLLHFVYVLFTRWGGALGRIPESARHSCVCPGLRTHVKIFQNN